MPLARNPRHPRRSPACYTQLKRVTVYTLEKRLPAAWCCSFEVFFLVYHNILIRLRGPRRYDSACGAPGAGKARVSKLALRSNPITCDIEIAYTRHGRAWPPG